MHNSIMKLILNSKTVSDGYPIPDPMIFLALPEPDPKYFQNSQVFLGIEKVTVQSFVAKIYKYVIFVAKFFEYALSKGL